MTQDKLRALAVQGAQLHGADGLVVRAQVDGDEHRHGEPHGGGAADGAHEQAPRQHAEEGDDGLLAPVLRVQLREVVVPAAGEVGAQARFGGAGGDPAERAEDARGGEEERPDVVVVGCG